MKRLLSGFVVLLMGFAAAGARAQIALYGMGSGGFLSSVSAQSGPLTLTSDSFSAYGGTFGIYDNPYHLGPLRLGVDGRGFVQKSSGSNANGNQLRGGLAGARIAFFSHLVPLSPYVQAEVGAVSTNYGTQSTRSTSLAYQLNGGLDYTLVPRLDLRIEYGIGQIGSLYSGTRQEVQQVGLGIVVRL